MTEKKVLKAEGVGELIGAVTALVGYVPTQSLVVAPFNGSRAEAAMRIDLPGDPSVLPEMVAQIMSLTCRVRGVTGFAAIVYTDAEADTYDDLASNLLAAAAFVGLEVKTIAYMAPSGWGEYFAGAARPLDALPPLPGSAPIRDGDQTAGASLPSVNEALRLKVEMWAATLDLPDDMDVCALFEDVPTWDAAALTGEQLATLGALLVRPALRDVALTQWASTLTEGYAALGTQSIHAVTGALPSAASARVFLGQGERPDVRRVLAVLEVCRAGAAHTLGGRRAAFLVCCAWLSWAIGRMTHADFYVGLAQDADPDLTFAPLLATAIQSGFFPDWAFTG